MSTMAIISEYNPYHLGHDYLLREGKRITGAECSIALMSGDFSQQGLPQLADKLTRAAAATASGIDLCFELPVLYATGSAHDFAEGAGGLLDALGNVDHLCFGAEHPEQAMFEKIADILLSEPSAYKNALSEGLSSGKNYPLAREEALASILGSQVRPLVREPNNILAIEYIRAIRKLDSPIKPVLIRRKGSYHGLSGSEGFPSATKIRKRIADYYQTSAFNDLLSSCPEELSEYLSTVLPDRALGTYRPVLTYAPLSFSLLMPYITGALLLSGKIIAEICPDIVSIPEALLPMDMTGELYNRLRHFSFPASMDQLTDHLNTRDMTLGRIRRCLLHLILGITNADRSAAFLSGQARYLNLLSARKESTSFLRTLQAESSLTLITKRSAYHPKKGSTAERLWHFDCVAADLYHQILFEASGIRKPDELRSTPVIH